MDNEALLSLPVQAVRDASCGQLLTVGCAMRGSEGKIQDAVIKYARQKYDALCKKNEVGRFMVSSGWPDYTIFAGDGCRCGNARVFFIEFKRPGGKLTELQAHCIDQLEEKGFVTYIVDSVEEGKKIFDREFR